MNIKFRLVLASVTLVAVVASPAVGQTPPPVGQGQGQQGQGQGQQGQGQQGRGGGRGGQQGQGGQGQGQGGGNRQPARDTQAQPQPTGTAGLSGTVVSDAGRPVRRARVTLSGAELRSAKAATTDDLGAFSFADLPAGRFTLSASKAGYVNSTYGQKKPGRPGTPIQLLDSQKMGNLKMTLPRGGVLTGTVLDEHGDPTPGTQVTAWRYEMRTGEKRLTQSGADQTDDRGSYRIYGLLPGDYIVRATPRNGLGDLRQVVQDVTQALTAGGGQGGGAGGGRGAQALGALGGGAGLQQLLGGRAGGAGGGQALQNLVAGLNGGTDDAGMGYAPVYYPGTTTSSSATTVSLGVSEERQALDFQLQLVTTATVSGTVTTPDGDAGGVMLTLVNETEQALGGAGINTTRTQPDGTFTFSNVAPGQYVVKARGGGGRGGRGGGGGRGANGAAGTPGAAAAPAPPPEQLWGQVAITIDGRAMSGVAISMQPGMKVNGHMTFDGGAAPTDLTRVRVALSPAATGGANDLAQNAPAQMDATGHFSISGVPPGRYTVRVQGQVQGFNLRSAMSGGRDALDFSIEVKPNEDIADVTLVMTTKTQELSGTLTDGQNQAATDYSVIIFATERQYWLPQSRRIVSLRPGTDGRFTARNLPAGEYYMAAVTDVEPGEWFDPEFLQQLRGAAVRVTLSDGDKKTQDLRIGG